MLCRQPSTEASMNSTRLSLLRLSLLIVAALFVAGVNRTDASLIAPDSLQLQISNLIAGDTASGGCASSQRPSDAGDGDQDDQDSDEQNVQKGLLSLGSPSSSSTTSTAGSGGGGISSFMALNTAISSSFADAAVFCWLSGERRVSLPMPIGNDLLRPPQY